MNNEHERMARETNRWHWRQMSRLAAIGLALLFLALFAMGVHGQAVTSFAKKDFVILKFPADVAKFEKYKPWSAAAQYVINVERTAAGGISLNGEEKWREQGFPAMTLYGVLDIDISSKKPSEIILSDTSSYTKRIKIVIPPTLQAPQVLSMLLFKGTSVAFLDSAYFRDLRDEFLPRMFAGPLATIPTDKQKKLFTWADLNTKAFSEASYKEKHYFSIDTTKDVFYNTIQLNQAERASRQTGDSLKRIKEALEIAGKIDGFDGMKAAATIRSYDFVKKNDVQSEKFEMFVPYELLQKYLNADITNQELVDSCVILIDGSRVKVNLTNFS